MTRAWLASLRRLGAVGPGRLAVAMVVVQLTVLSIVGWYAPQLGPREPFAADWEELVVTSADLVGTIVSHLQRWDALWYQHIAQGGYSATDGSVAFLPLYPVLASLVSRPLMGNVPLALILVSCVGYAIALWLVGRLTLHEAPALLRRWAGDPDTTGDRARTLAVLTMLSLGTFPTAFFFVAPFTESLFLLLAVASMWFARTGRLWAAALAAALASLVRTQGVFLALPIAWEAMRTAGVLDRVGALPDRRSLARAAPGVVAATLPVIVLVAWYAAIGSLFGSSAVGLSAQAPWGYQLAAPWDAIEASVAYISARQPAPMSLIEGLNLVCLVGFAGLTVVARRLPFSYLLYVVPTLVLYGTRLMWFIPLMSVSRYVLMLFPCFIGLGMILERRPRVAMGWLLVSAIAQLVLFQWWVRWGFVA